MIRNMSRSRLRLAIVGFLICLVSAWAKNWFPGIDGVLIMGAVVNIGVYIWGETSRPSGPPGS